MMDAKRVAKEEQLILGPPRPLQRLGRITLFVLCAFACFGAWVIDAVIDNKEFCVEQAPPSAPPAPPALSAARTECALLADERGAIFSEATGVDGAPAGCILLASGGGGGLFDASSGVAALTDSVVFVQNCAQPLATCTACSNCTVCAGCTVLRTLAELELSGQPSVAAPWTCPRWDEKNAAIRHMLAFFIYSIGAFVTSFLLLTRDHFNTKWTLLARLPHDGQVVIATIVLGYGWPYVLPLLLRKTHAVSRFFGQAQHQPDSWPYKTAIGACIRGQHRRLEKAKEYRAQRAIARRTRAEERGRRKQERIARRNQAAQGNSGDNCNCTHESDECGECCFFCCWVATDLDCCFCCWFDSCSACCDGADQLLGCSIDWFLWPFELAGDACTKCDSQCPDIGCEPSCPDVGCDTCCDGGCCAGCDGCDCDCAC